MEFQRRGAIHFHAFLRVPALSGLDEDRYEVLKAWGFRVWSEIAGFSKDRWDGYHHERMGLRFNVSPGWYAGSLSAVGIAEYLVAHAAKGAQKELPAGMERPGRFWGSVGERNRCSATQTSDLCCEHSLADVMRVLRHWGRGGAESAGQVPNAGSMPGGIGSKGSGGEGAGSVEAEVVESGGRVAQGRARPPVGVLGPWAVGLCPVHGQIQGGLRSTPGGSGCRLRLAGTTYSAVPCPECDREPGRAERGGK